MRPLTSAPCTASSFFHVPQEARREYDGGEYARPPLQTFAFRQAIASAAFVKAGLTRPAAMSSSASRSSVAQRAPSTTSKTSPNAATS